MNFGSLFSGFGGMDLGLERAGMRCIWQVENNLYAQKVLAKHWPAVRRWDDVRTFPPKGDWSCDLIAGGFPCTDVSQAGRRVGIDGRHSGLWSEFYRIIRRLRPRYVLVENTPGLLHRGMDRVLGNLAASGYDAEWSVLPGCALGASHSRPRVFLLAYPAGGQSGQLRRIARAKEGEARRCVPWPETKPGIHRILDGVPARLERLTGIGNAVIPQVAEWIGGQILEFENR